MKNFDPPTRPLLSVSINPTMDGDQEKLARALSHLADENPSLTVSTESTDGRVVLGVTSESQLESVCDQISREFQIELLIDEPKVIYLETIRRTFEAEGKYIRQTGGHGNYGHVKLRLEPGDSGSGYRFVNETKDGQIPAEFIEPVNLGILEAARLGILAGYEMVDFRAVLYDGSYHAEDSNEMAFKFAGSIAFKEAARKALPIVLEPVMSIEAEYPEIPLGDIVGYLNRLRGRIESTECSDGWVTIQAIVPLAELLQASANGGPVYPMRFAGYEPAPRSGWNRDDGAGVTANKPDRPRTRGGVASAWPEAEQE
jgi:elongation factor G